MSGIKRCLVKRGLLPRQYLLCRAELITWRLRCPNMGNAEETKYFFWNSHACLHLCMTSHHVSHTGFMGSYLNTSKPPMPSVRWYWAFCLVPGALPPRQYLFSRAELTAWRLRRPKIGNAKGTKIATHEYRFVCGFHYKTTMYWILAWWEVNQIPHKLPRRTNKRRERPTLQMKYTSPDTYTTRK